MATRTTSAGPHDDYVLARTADEYGRRRARARMFEPDTARLLDRVGIAPGARCLDVGCGPGENMRLMAERVGPDGEVVGADVDVLLGAQAIEDLHAAGHRHCRFHALDAEYATAMPGARFDLVFARALLLHVRDEVAVLRRLWGSVAPGGHLVVQDFNITTSEVVPPLESATEVPGVALATFRAAGSDLDLGLRVPALFAEAGIGAPDEIDAVARIAPLPALAGLYEGVHHSILPAALALGVTTQPEADAWRDAFARETAGAERHTALWPLLIGVRKRKEVPAR